MNQQSLSRRMFVGLAGGGMAAAMLGHAAEPPRPQITVRDRLCIFTTPSGSSNNYMEVGGFRGGSRMTPAEGAFYLNVPNLILVRNRDLPSLPSNQQWRAKTEYEQYAIAFQPLKKVIWSVVGSGGKGGMSELPHVLALAKKFPNIGGIFLDDYVVESKKQPDGRTVGRPAVMPEELKSARERMKTVGRPMEIWVTLYTHELDPKHPRYKGCEPALAGFLDLFDVLTLWTWNGEEVRQLDESMATLESLAPKTARKALGLYMWDYFNKRPMPIELMELQCERGLKWLREGRVQYLIFLSSTLCDMGLPSVEFARQWIAEVGGQPL